MKRTKRNLIIFILVSLTFGFLGSAVNRLTGQADSMESLGVLIWLVAPLAANLLLRALGGDGWADFGLRPRFKSAWRWYVVALLVPALVSLILVGVSAGLDSLNPSSLKKGSLQTFLSLLVVSFGGSMVKNIFEEFAWRGYLAPQLAKLSKRVILNAIITGVVWAAWHIPYYYFFLSQDVLRSQTALSIPVLILIGIFMLPFQSLLYNELRLISQSVWPAWLMHTVSNAFSFAIVGGGFVAVSDSPLHVLFTPGTEGILYALLYGLAGWWLYQQRLGKKS
jgi:membrane protease YdiL (CAAX protease family)